MIVIYLLFLLLFGYFIYYSILKIKMVESEKLNVYEKISFISFLGFFSYAFFFLILNIFKIKFSTIFWFFIFIIDLYSLYLILRKIIYKKERFKIEFKKNKKVILPLCLLSLLCFYFLTEAYCHNLQFPDEFSAWALNAKNIFLGKGMHFFVNTGLENYPPFLPILYSGFYFFIGNISENEIRIIPTIITIIGMIGFIGLTEKKKIPIHWVLYSLIFVFLTYTGITSLVSSTYGDMPFSIFYTLGMIYFLEWFFNNDSRNDFILSIFYLSCSSFIKTDGLYMLVLNYLLLTILIFVKLINKEKVNYKSYILFFFSTMFVPILWKIFTIIFKFPTTLAVGAGSKFEIHVEYIDSLLKSMFNQQFTCYPWLLILILFIVLIFVKRSKMTIDLKKYIFLGITIVFFSSAFLFICYLSVFGAEAITAASYVRYLTRSIFIAIYIVLILMNAGDVENEIKK